MSLRWTVLSGLGALLAYSACAYPDFQFEEDEGDGGGSTTTTTTSTDSGGMTGSGGSTACALGVVGACGDGMKCTVINPGTGEVGCRGAGPRGPFARCEDDLECVDGTFCDLQIRTCKPICQSGNDCAMGAQCYPAGTSGGGDIPGLKLCTAHCHPVNGNPCDAAYGVVTCFYDVDRAEFDCAATINLQELASCTSPTDCATGLGCVGPTGNAECRLWCTPLNSSCPFILDICTGLNPSVMYNSTEYGLCL